MTPKVLNAIGEYVTIGILIRGEIRYERDNAVEFTEINHNFGFSFKLYYKVTKNSIVMGYFYTYKGLFCANCYIITFFYYY